MSFTDIRISPVEYLSPSRQLRYFAQRPQTGHFGYRFLARLGGHLFRQFPLKHPIKLS